MTKQIYLLVVFILTMNLSSYADDSRLKQIVKELNKDCPAFVSEGITMDKVDYIGHTVSVFYGIDAQYMDYDGIRANEEAMKDNMLISFANAADKDFEMMINAIIEADASLNVVFDWKNGKKVTMRFSTNELKANRPGSHADPESLLKTLVDNGRLQTPLVVSEGLIMSDVVLGPRYYMFVYDCDESEYDIDYMNENASWYKEDVLEDIKNEQDPMAQKIYNLIKTTHRGLAYKYIGSSSGKTFTIYIEPDEL